MNVNMNVNTDVLAGKWKQLKGKVRQRWGRLTKSDLERIKGRFEELVGLIQECYGYTRARAKREVDHFLRQLRP